MSINYNRQRANLILAALYGSFGSASPVLRFSTPEKPRKLRTWTMPHQGKRECERRRRQLKIT